MEDSAWVIGRKAVRDLVCECDAIELILHGCPAPDTQGVSRESESEHAFV